jgi:hypothetical protein
VVNPAAFDRLELRMKYDDGFVAFLNGAVLTSTNAPASPQWNSASTASHEASSTAFDIFDVTAKMGNLRAGHNVLAIQALNENTNSSDMILVPELYGAKLGTGAPRQPTINFGTIDANPASGNQDEEYIQLMNPNGIAVDISDWRLTGRIEHKFTGGTVLPPNGSIYVSPNAAAFRARTVSPKGSEGRFVQGSYKGHLASLGGTITLLDSASLTNNTTTYVGQPSDAQRFIVVSELMYNPPGDGLAEFIELLNISDSVTLNLKDVHFNQGVDFTFTGSAVTNLAPGKRVLVVRDRAAFESVYGTNLPVAGVFTNGSALSNGGERIELLDGDNQTIQDFSYKDSPPWPAGTDGIGYSLVLINPRSNPDHRLAANWRSSAIPGGTPGETDEVPCPSDPMADANGNGERDLIDYAFGNDLGKPAMFPTFALQSDPLGGPDSLALSYPRSIGAERAVIDVFFSTDLLTWQPGAGNLEAMSTQQLGDGRALVTWRVKAPLSAEPRLFMQVRVTAQ